MGKVLDWWMMVIYWQRTTVYLDIFLMETSVLSQLSFYSSKIKFVISVLATIFSLPLKYWGKKTLNPGTKL